MATEPDILPPGGIPARDKVAALRHELRTPLNAIVGSISLLERGVPEHSRDRVHLERLKRNSRHLAAMLDDVLDLLRADAGALAVSPARYRLQAAVEDALANVELHARAGRVSIVNAVAETSAAWYWGDEGRVRQIVVNLVANAVKFTAPEGRVELTGGTLADAAAAPAGHGAWTYLRVADTGRGIPSGHLTSVFEPFQQVEPADRRHGQGLGLSISRQFARAMHGDITLASEVGAGSIFTLWLPAAPDDVSGE
jgi:signal transduction histidine kinase